MVLDRILPWLLLGAVILAIVGMVRRVLLWRRGQPEQVALLSGLMAMPRRYLVDLHHVVARDKYMSRSHVATAGGFVLSMLLILVVHLAGVSGTLVDGVLAGALLVMFSGALFIWYRRRNPPARLSRGPWMRLPKSLLVFAATFFITTLPVSDLFGEAGRWVMAALLLAGICWGLGEMVFGRPMKHAFAGALHLAFHRRPARFGGGRSVGLKPVDLAASKLGVEKPADFKWNQLLGFDACVQCGKCEAM